MTIYVLSSRRIVEMPSNGVAAEFEDLVVETCEGALLAPPRPARYLGRLARATRRWGLHLGPRTPLEGKAADRVLLVVGLWTELLEAVVDVPRWRSQFALVAGYIFDPWCAWGRWPGIVPRAFDRIFVPDEPTAERFRGAHGMPAQCVPMGADVLRCGSAGVDRPLDVVAYGRQHPAFVAAIGRAFNDPRSPRFLYHDTLVGQRAKSFPENRRLIWKLLHKSRCTLCFDTQVAPGNLRHGRSILPIRYYEGAAAGAAIVGIHPRLPEMAEQFGWEDATISLPEDPAAAVPFLEGLLEDGARLAAIHRRNHAEAWRRHDWRYRIRDMLVALGVPLPARLAAELGVLAKGPPPPGGDRVS